MHTVLHTSISDPVTVERLAGARLKGNLREIFDDIEYAADDFDAVTRETPLEGLARDDS